MEARELFELSAEKIEKTIQKEPVSPECNNFLIFPDEYTKTISISPSLNGAILRLNKKEALAIVAIIQDCVRKW